MRHKEQKLWDTMRNNKPPGIWLERVENGLGAGMPDVYFRTKGFHGWIELKAPIAPKRKETRVLGDEGLSQEQINWHLQSHRLGLTTFILIRDSEGRLWLVVGCLAEQVNDWNAEELYGNCIAADDWELIFNELRGVG